MCRIFDDCTVYSSRRERSTDKVEQAMQFEPFNREDFRLMECSSGSTLPEPISSKVSALREALGQFPEFGLGTFRTRIVRRPSMRGRDGLVFGPPRIWDRGKHWYLYNVGGDQDMVQLNVGMWPDSIRVGLGFQIGRQVAPKIPAFQLFQLFLGARPPLPFRDAFFSCIKENGFSVENQPQWTTAEQIVQGLETYVVPADQDPHFIFVGKLWPIENACEKVAEDYRSVFLALLPFYEALILMGGRFVYYPTDNS